MDPLSASITAFTVIVLFFVLLKLLIKFSTGWDRSPTCLVGKTVIVTGANTGIGFYAALDFAKRGARVILACRDEAKAEKAKMRIVAATGNTNVVVRVLDLSSFASVRRFVIETKTIEERLDILVNNAGAYLDHVLTIDGLSATMQTNYFGPFLLTILLSGILKRSAPSRVVNVASLAALTTNLKINDLKAFPRGIFSKEFEYGNSKLCNILFTTELATKLKGTGVDTNCLHPGVVQSEFFRGLLLLGRIYLSTIGKLYHKTPEEGAQTTIYLAVSKDIAGVSGQFFLDCKQCYTPKKWKNENLARQLWKETEKIVNLLNEEKL